METAVYLEIINKDCRALLLILIEKAFKKSQGMGHWSVGGVRLINKIGITAKKVSISPRDAL